MPIKPFERNKKSKNKTVVFLYKDPSSKTLGLNAIKKYLEALLGSIKIVLRNEFVSYYVEPENIDRLAIDLARCKVRNLNRQNTDFEPLWGEVEFEKKLLKHPERKITGILYDGFKLMSTFRKLIPKSECNLNSTHIIFTNRLFGTFDENDLRYHARVIICGYPSIISTTGIVEAPAKSKEFYNLKWKYASLGLPIPTELLDKKFRTEFIDYDDERLTEVMKGYTLQAIFYHLMFEPFCNNRRCRLFNAHWQKEVIEAQLKSRKLCRKHEKILSDLKLKLK